MNNNQKSKPIFLLASKFSQSRENIIKPIENILKKIDCSYQLREATCCENAFDILSDCRDVNIRIFSTSDHDFSHHILHYVCNVNEYKKSAVNIDITTTQNSNYISCYQPDKFPRTILLNYNHIANTIEIESFIENLLKPTDVYISYGNRDGGKARVEIKNIKEHIDYALPYINLRFDFSSEYKDDISLLMENIKKAENIILLINKEYLESEYAMAEFVGIIDESQNDQLFHERVFPLVTESGKLIYNKSALMKIVKKWKEECQVIEDIIKDDEETANDLNLKEELDLYRKIQNYTTQIPELIGKMAAANLKDHTDNSFVKLIWAIHQKIKEKKGISIYNKEEDLKDVMRRYSYSNIKNHF